MTDQGSIPDDDPDAAGDEQEGEHADSGTGTVAHSGGGPRFIQFLRASAAELQRVQWPDRRQVAQATAVVLGFVVIAGAYLGVADWVANQIVNAIL